MRRPHPLWIFIATGAVLLSSCGGNKTSSNDGVTHSQPSTVTPKKSVPVVGSRLEWLRTGGGNLEFMMTKVGSAEYSIHVTRSNYQDIDTTLRLDSSDSMFSTVESVLNGSFTIPTISSSAPTGSWLSLVITLESEVETISEADIADATLRSIEDWVQAGLPNSG